MNPYVTFGLAMCVITLLALAGTSYMAVYFNRKAKADLDSALEPLAKVVQGTYELDDAIVEGRFGGHLTECGVVLRPGGMGRVFSLRVFDGAGGEPWEWTLTRSKDLTQPPKDEFAGALQQVQSSFETCFGQLRSDPSLAETWFKVDYDPDAGHVRLVRPMKTRRDIPSAAVFEGYLNSIVGIAETNREVQQSATAQT